MFKMTTHEEKFNISAVTIIDGRVSYIEQKMDKVSNELIKAVGQECTTLDLSFNELTDISRLEDLKQLKELILDNNNLRNLESLACMPTLITLSLNNNKISNIDKALDKIKKCCPNIEYLSLLGNPGYRDQLTDSTVDENDYKRNRLYVIHTLSPTLRFLDSQEISQEEKENAKIRGKFCRTIRLIPEMLHKLKPKPDEFEGIRTSLYFNVYYTPLPSSHRNPEDHTGVYGKCKYRYSGENSEGNRYILNSDL